MNGAKRKLAGLVTIMALMSLLSVSTRALALGEDEQLRKGNNSVHPKKSNGRKHSTKRPKWQRKAWNWYVRMKVEAPEHGFVDNSSLLGHIRKKDAANKYSLIGLPPFGSDYLYITFIDPEGVDEPGEYKTSFHRGTRKNRREDLWEFTVKSSDPDNDIIISWSDIVVLKPYVDAEGRIRFREFPVPSHRLGKRMKLVDLLTFEDVPMLIDKELQSYSFNMDGQTERHLAWVLEKRHHQKNPDDDFIREIRKEYQQEIREHARQIKAYLKQQRKERFRLDEPPVDSE